MVLGCRSVIAFGLFGACLGCSVTRHAPQADSLVELPAAYAATPVEGHEVRSLAAALESAELEALIDRAFDGNLNLQAAWARVSQAESAVREARAGFFPRVQGSFEAERTNVPTRIGMGGDPGAPPNGPMNTGGSMNNGPNDFEVERSATNRFTGSLGASFELDVWGRLGSRHRAALLDAAGSRRDAEALAISLAAEVAEAWSSIAAQRERRAILARQIETAEDILGLVRRRFEEGFVGAEDVAQQEQQAEAMRGRQILLRGELRTEAFRLAVLLGEAPGRLPRVAQERLPDPLPLISPGLPGDLLDRRPDVRAARLRLEAADEMTAAAVADRLPGLRLTANLFDQAETLSNLFSDVFWSVGGAIQQELFAGGRRRAEILGAEASAEAQLYDYGQTLLEAMQEVQSALVSSEQQEAYAASLARQLEYARLAFEANLHRYRQGDAPFLNVLISLQTANNVEIDLLEARARLFSSRIQLWRALGGAWQMEMVDYNGE